ncbi:MAG: 3,4-dihydroxy-2-butanone 4-phosphate synthase [Methanosaeta sp. PtaB.Bin039]|nr:MAG: 3,4-dihydroxy-2-butanone 4-phosphate synthase [Methanosaeta sp. PtaB.Bin039]OPY45418.1 MAG: 3,4-dihydroxy-2-butanone 4-phosphate synthase [Methanosaeta sp. PtaU1.Bin028]HOT06319.1 3,4-dihydroxy-2-butanone-4-phosphate synthase [Methanotrichaceae archaeon]HQF15758.1 3,4-dihydroxy-2-butanone-4-phosphate synthase [Methanotrichaceae archaeon]HQI90568.1 3,4-dihydroxy-2-butanone-4-phosphate synthase [Methanotrichaceae archaeon]
MIDDAIDSLAAGEPILLYDFDDRERETDLMTAAQFITPQMVYQMRKDAGGLICVAIDPLACEALGLPYFADLLRQASHLGHDLLAIESLCEQDGDIPYDTRSSFSIWVNHRGTYTGITDADRTLTIRELADATRRSLNGGRIDLGSEFRSPGHVPLLRTAPGLLKERRGQTELSIVLAREAKVIPAMVMCEMLDGRTGQSLGKEDAREYALSNGLAFAEGREVEELFDG